MVRDPGCGVDVMGNFFEFEVQGVEETIRALSKASVQKQKEFEVVVRKSTQRVNRYAKANVSNHQKTGNLRNSIRAKYFFKDGPASTVFPRGRKGAHRHLVEYGTEVRRHKNGKSVGRMKAYPFMKPAHEKEEPRFIEEVKKVVDENITV